MIQLLCNGVSLDLYENVSLQFEKTNPFFAFDNLKCERTTQFKLPSTPKNDKVLSLARIPAYKGEGMRRKFDAKLQSSAVVKEGYLYIDSFDGKDYAAIFVTGELLGLQRIRDLGNINESGVFDDYGDTVMALDGATPGVSAQSAINTLWENVEYKHTSNEGLHPSISIKDLLAEMGITDSGLIVDTLNLRWIPQKMQPIQDDNVNYTVNFKNSHDGGYVPISAPAVNVSVLSINGSIPSQGFIKTAFVEGGYRVLVKYTSGGSEYHGYITMQRTKYHTYIFMPNSTPNDVFMGYFNIGSGGVEYANLSDFNFLGGWEFDEDGVETGTPLAGRTIILPPETLFCFIRKSWWSQDGWNISTPDFSIQGVVLLFDEFEDDPPKVWRLKDNLPSCTAVDLLKSIAAMTGSVLYYTEAEGVILDRVILDGGRFDLTDKIISVSDVSRKFANYAQHNFVEFKDDETQFASEKVNADYTIDNDNLAEEKILQTLPAGNGAIFGTHQTLYVRGEQGADIFARYDSNSPVYLCRVGLEKNDDIQALCDASTSVTIKARLSLLEYERIQPRTQLYYDGVLYMWTEIQYSKGVATFKLSKINI